MFCRLLTAFVKYFTVQPLLAIVLCRNVRHFVIVLGSVTLVFFVYSLAFGMRAPEIGKTSSLDYFRFSNTDDIVVFEPQVRTSNASNSGTTTSSGKATQSPSLQNTLFKIQRRAKNNKQMMVATNKNNRAGKVRSEGEDEAFSRVVLVLAPPSQDELREQRRNLTLEVATRSTCSEVSTPTVGTTVTTTTATTAAAAQSHKVDISGIRLTPITNVSCVIYNRVPKCGSSTVLSIFSAISRQNGVSYVWSGIYTRPHINVKEQKTFLKKGLAKTSPGQSLLMERHLHFVNFHHILNVSQPLYVNIIREPMDRLVSWFYYRRSNMPLRTKRMGNSRRNMTFDECVAEQQDECLAPGGDSFEVGYFKIIPYFCGQDDFCLLPSRQALNQAKKHIIQHYVTVGVTESMDKFLQMLEILLPSYFTGSTWLYTQKKGSREKLVLKRTHNRPKESVSPQTAQIMKDKLALEYELYYFVRQRFYNQLRKLAIAEDDKHLATNSNVSQQS